MHYNGQTSEPTDILLRRCWLELFVFILPVQRADATAFNHKPDGRWIYNVFMDTSHVNLTEDAIIISTKG